MSQAIKTVKDLKDILARYPEDAEILLSTRSLDGPSLLVQLRFSGEWDLPDNKTGVMLYGVELGKG